MYIACTHLNTVQPRLHGKTRACRFSNLLSPSNCCDLPSLQFVSLWLIHQFINLLDRQTKTAPSQSYTSGHIVDRISATCARRASRFAKLIRRQQIGNKTLTILLRLERGGAFFVKLAVKSQNFKCFIVHSARKSRYQACTLLLHDRCIRRLACNLRSRIVVHSI